MAQLNILQRWWINSWPHRWYVRWYVPQFLKASPDPIRGEVLEIGSGKGWTSKRILETFPQVELTATDVDYASMRVFDRLQKEYGRRLKVKEADISKLPFDRDSFDFIIAINVIQYLTLDTVQKALLEVLRVARPGGLVGISGRFMTVRKETEYVSCVERVLKEEQCKVLHKRRNGSYEIWVRKSYPIEEET